MQIDSQMLECAWERGTKKEKIIDLIFSGIPISGNKEAPDLKSR